MNYKPYQNSLESIPDKAAIARQLVGVDILVRRSDQSINFPGLVIGLFFVVGVPYLWLRSIDFSINHASSARPTFSAVHSARVTPFRPLGSRAVSTFTQVFVPTYTSYPTYTPYPTVQPSPTPELVTGLFSFYDPMIGVDKPEIALVNCDNWDAVNKTCLSGLRDGSHFQDHYFDSMACPSDLYFAGAAYNVISPKWLADLVTPVVTCRDTGGAVVAPYFDFLIPWKSMPFDYDKIPWRTPVVMRRVR